MVLLGLVSIVLGQFRLLDLEPLELRLRIAEVAVRVRDFVLQLRRDLREVVQLRLLLLNDCTLRATASQCYYNHCSWTLVFSLALTVLS